MIGERTNVTGSRALRAADPRRTTTRTALEVAREQVRGGANILDVNMDEGMLDSEQAMTTLPQPDRRRAGHRARADHDRQLEVVGASRRGCKCVQGKGDRQLDQPQGRRGGLPAPRRALVRRYGAGVVVMAFDEEGQADTRRAQGRDLRARLPAPRRGGRLPARGHHLRPQHPRRRHRASRSTTATRVDFIEATRAASRSAAPGAKVSGGVSNLSFSFRGNDAVREAMHAAFLYHAIAGRAGHGHRQRRPARGLRGDPAGAARARRGRPLQPPRRRHRAAGRVRRDGAAATGKQARGRPRLARGAASRSGSRTPWSTASPTTSRRTPRRRGRSYGAPARRHRRAR